MDPRCCTRAHSPTLIHLGRGSLKEGEVDEVVSILEDVRRRAAA